MLNPYLVYFAHPAFTPEQIDFKYHFVDAFNSAIKLVNDTAKFPVEKDHEVKLLDPFDFSPTIEADRETKKLLTKSILKINLRLIEMSSMVIAVIDDRDIGVAVEVGFALARDIPIITISKTNFDSNIMLHGASVAHITSVLDPSSMKNLSNIVYGFSSTM